MDQVVKVPLFFEPYATADQYVQDQLVLLDLLLEAAMYDLNNPTTERKDKLSPFKGMYLSEAEAQQLLEAEPTYLTLDVEQQTLIEKLEYMMQSRLQQNIEQQRLLPIQELEQRLELDYLDIRLLIVALAPHINRKYLKLYGYLQDDLTCQYVTLDLLLRLCCRNREEHQLVYTRMSSAASKLKYLFTSFASQAIARKDASLLVEPIMLETRILHFLLGLSWQYSGSLSSLRHIHFTEAVPTLPIKVQQSIYTKMLHYVKYYENQPFSLLMIGGNGSGKTLHSQHLALELGKSILELDASTLPADHDQLNQTIALFLHEAKLLHAIPVLHRLDQLIADDQKLEQDSIFLHLQEQFTAWDDLIILHSSQSLPLSLRNDKTNLITVTFPSLTELEGSGLWKHYTNPELQITTNQALQLATKFQFTAGQIAAASLQAKKLKQWPNIDGKQLEKTDDLYWLQQAAYQLIHHGLQQKAVKLQSEWSWQDLILPQETLGLLQQACHRVENRHIVMHEWGFNALLPYGRGVSMLFTGPPGTGKTMSALVMAKAMNTELYRVDLTRVVSKYIGETEKNLGEIFDRARLSGAILFFDEADALFGKRSEVKDAHDKYANMETSYLLQKMEEYEGLTILATNFSQNLDEAFMRRIQYVIKFPFPDVAQREQLWQAILPYEFIAEEVDIAFLAKTFELTGGPIKNIVLTAAYLAVQEQSKLTMQYLIEAAIQEYKKTGKLLLKDRLGPYAHYWKG